MGGQSADALLEAVATDWAARFDAAAAGEARLTVGLRLLADPDSPGRQLVVAAGRCTVQAAAGAPERLTVIGAPLTLVRWSLGRLDPWEALLRGDLVVRGDGDLGLRLVALFPPYPLDPDLLAEG